MTYTVKKGRHRAWPLRLGLFFKAKTVRRFVTFKQATYFIAGDDMLDTNKLFGLAFLPDGVHKESARFGWRYDNAKSIVLSAYCYIKGERVIKELCKVPMFRKITCALYVINDSYIFDVLIDGVPYANEIIQKYHSRKFSFPLGVYFGGNQTAPQTIKIDLKK